MRNDPAEKPETVANISLGEGRKLQPFGTCPNSPDGKHQYASVSCVQSVEHFVCDFCPDEFYD